MSVNFNIYKTEGEDLEKFQGEWRKSTNFFISRELEIEKASLEKSDAIEEVPKERLQLGGAPNELLPSL